MVDDLANRLARELMEVPGVRAAVVTNHAGDLLAAAGGEHTARRAALAAFLVRRADGASLGGDLRGLGRVVAQSRLEHVLFAGPGGEGALLVAATWLVLVAFERGTAAELAVTTVRQVLRHYAPTPLAAGTTPGVRPG